MPVQVVQKAHIRVVDLPDYSMESVSTRMIGNGNYCVQCGGQMVQTGTCETCMSCGHNTGCG